MIPIERPAAMQIYRNKRKGLNPTGLVWNTNMAAVLLFRNTNMADVTSCEKALLTNCKMKSFYYYFHNVWEFCFLVQISAFAVLKLFRIAKFLCEGKTKWILVVVVKYRQRANGLVNFPAFFFLLALFVCHGYLLHFSFAFLLFVQIIAFFYCLKFRVTWLR